MHDTGGILDLTAVSHMTSDPGHWPDRRAVRPTETGGAAHLSGRARRRRAAAHTGQSGPPGGQRHGAQPAGPQAHRREAQDVERGGERGAAGDLRPGRPAREVRLRQGARRRVSGLGLRGGDWVVGRRAGCDIGMGTTMNGDDEGDRWWIFSRLKYLEYHDGRRKCFNKVIALEWPCSDGTLSTGTAAEQTIMTATVGGCSQLRFRPTRGGARIPRNEPISRHLSPRHHRL